MQRLLHEGRIPGAKKYSVSWLIPAGSEKPAAPGPAAPEQAPAAREATPAEAAPVAAGPCLFPVLYLHGDNLAQAYQRCEDDEERALLDAWLAYFHGEAREARAQAARLYQRTERVRVRLGAGLVLATAAMALADVSAWKRTLQELTAMRVPEEMRMERDFVVAALNVALHSRGAYPRWLEQGAFIGLPEEMYPAARWMYCEILYVKWKELDLLAVAEPLIAECRREGSDLCELYLRLLAATACFDLGDAERARAHLCEAAKLARPQGLISPLSEYRRTLGGLMDECLALHYPEGLAPVRQRMQPFMESWTKVYNACSERPMAAGLTPREYEACILFSRGLTAREIANRMLISRASVKKYLNAAYNKLGLTDKNQLRQLIHT